MSMNPLSLEPETQEPKTALADELKQSEQLFTLLVSSVKDYAIFVLDPDGHVLTWNEGARYIKGYEASEIIGQHFSKFYPKEAQDAKYPEKELKIAIRQGRYEEEGWRLRKDGSRFWANVVITPLFSENGVHVGFAKVTRNLTERMQREQKLDEMARTLARTNEELQNIAYIVSHELQAPVATISSYCKLLTVRYKDKLGPDAIDFMSKMIDSSKLIARIIDDLWSYARVTKPNQEAELVDMNQELENALSDQQEVITQDEISHEALPSIRGNTKQLAFLLRELILNAVRNRSSVPLHVVVRAKEDGDGWQFSVTDNGKGIDKVAAGDIFKVFHRITGRLEASATGMGLAICKKIVEVHKGRIWFESNLGQGTTMFFWLPK